MISPIQYLHNVEYQLLQTRVVSEQLCRAFLNLPVESQQAFGRAMVFAGCELFIGPMGNDNFEVQEADRIRAAGLMLFKLSVDTGEPRWSSLVLERMLEAIMTTPGGTVSDLFHALFILLDEQPGEITRTMASFFKELTIQCYTRYHHSYESADFGWMVERVNERPTMEKAYIALYTIPETLLPKVREPILKTLEQTSFREEAIQNLRD